MKPRVIIYMPFYSGSLEARHARMHDLIHYLNTRSDLAFEYNVFGEKGKDKDSRRVYYGSVPFFKKYTQTYKNIRPKRGHNQSKNELPAPRQHSRMDKKTERLDQTVKTENPDHEINHGQFVVLRTSKIVFRKCKQGMRKGMRFGRRAYRRVKNYADPQYMTRRVCVFILLARCRLRRKVDVLHIVRPNRVSSLVEQNLRKKNPRLRVIVGPNIMSYGDLSETYDANYFKQDYIEAVLAIGSYHRELLKRFGVPEHKLLRLPPNVDASVFYPKSNRTEDDKNGCMRILFASSQLAVEKGTHTFFEAIRLLKMEKGIDFTVMVAGSEAVIPKVQTPFDRSLLDGMEGHIEMLGQVSRSRMPELYRQADVFVHAGRPEAGPTTTIESLSCGTPCILPNHPSFKEPEIIPACLFFPMGDSQALKDCLIRFYHGWIGGEQPQVSIPAIEPNVAKEFVTQVYLGTICPPRNPS